MKIPNPPSPPFDKRGDFKVTIYPARTNLLRSGDQVSIQAAVLNRLGEVGGLDILLAFKVGNDPGQL
jgi:hypothetical protein